MLTRRPARRTRLLVAALGLAISAALAASGTAVAHHNQSFGMTGCVNASGDLVLTATWSRMRVTDWSFFVESSEGSGGTFQPVPAPGNSGTVTNTFTELDPATVSSLRVSLFNGSGQELATGTLNQRPAGWPACLSHNNTFGVTACVTPTGEIVLTATWNRMRVTHWSFFVESSEGSGGTFQPVPAPGPSGTVTQSFEGDPAALDAVSVSLFGGPTGGRQLATARLTQRPAGWPPC